MYLFIFDGITVLLLWQVDNFTLVCPNEALAKHIYGIIGPKLQLPSENKPPFAYLGLATEFNWVSFDQMRDYVSISCPQYISPATSRKIVKPVFSEIFWVPVRSDCKKKFHHFHQTFTNVSPNFHHLLPKFHWTFTICQFHHLLCEDERSEDTVYVQVQKREVKTQCMYKYKRDYQRFR